MEKTVTLTELQSKKLQQLYAQKSAVDAAINGLTELIADAHGIKKEDEVTISEDFKTLLVKW